MFLQQHSTCNLKFEDFEDFLETFSGDNDKDIREWLKNFEEMAKVCKWTDLQKVFYARRLLTGSAKAFVEQDSKYWERWSTTKRELIQKFQNGVDCNQVHEELAKEKKRDDETYEEYIYRMLDIALPAEFQTSVILYYIIEGIDDEPKNKAILYQARTIEGLKKKFDQYEKMKNEEKMKNQAKPTESGEGNKKDENLDGVTPTEINKSSGDLNSSDEGESTPNRTAVKKDSKVVQSGHTEKASENKEKEEKDREVELKKESNELQTKDEFTQAEIEDLLLDLEIAELELGKLEFKCETPEPSEDGLEKEDELKQRQTTEVEREEKNVSIELNELKVGWRKPQNSQQKSQEKTRTEIMETKL